MVISHFNLSYHVTTTGEMTPGRDTRVPYPLVTWSSPRSPCSSLTSSTTHNIGGGSRSPASISPGPDVELTVRVSRRCPSMSVSGLRSETEV